jgi:hypothetical protein
MRRAVMIAALAARIPAGRARAQLYPLYPDYTRVGVPAWPTQGWSPTTQMGNPGVEPGVPWGVVPGQQSPPRGGPRPPAPLPPDTEASLPDPERLDFHSRDDLPDGVTMASVISTPDGDRAIYMRLPPGGHVPAFSTGTPFTLRIIRGDARIVGESAVLHPVEPSAPVAIPARSVTELFCGRGVDCLLYLSSVHPIEFHTLHHP